MSHTGTMPWDKAFDDMDEEYSHIFKKPIRWGYKILKAERIVLFSDGSEETDIVENIDAIDLYRSPRKEKR